MRAHTNEKIVSPWHLGKINGFHEMTRINGDSIECRPLNRFEKFFFFWAKNKPKESQ